MSLTGCIKKAGGALRAEDKAAILARARELRSDGLSADAAGAQAVKEQIATVSKLMENPAESLAARTKKEAPTTNAAPDQREASRVDTIAAESPDMLVVLPGKDQMLTVADALKEARAEHAMDTSEADLLQAAAECAIGFGA
jgi:hypothetical protein